MRTMRNEGDRIPKFELFEGLSLSLHKEVINKEDRRRYPRLKK
jgi:hypothetical protein